MDAAPVRSLLFSGLLVGRLILESVVFNRPCHRRTLRASEDTAFHEVPRHSQLNRHLREIVRRLNGRDVSEQRDVQVL